MSRESLYRSLEANQAYYAQMFAHVCPTHEQIRTERKLAIINLYREVAMMESRMQALEAELGFKYSPDQARVPAGSPDGGQWTNEDGGSGMGIQYADSGQFGTDAQADESSNNQNISQPAKNFSISQDGINFIANHETFRPSVYPDQAGYLTIGYGHKLTQGESYPDGITRDEALQLLRSDVDTAETAVRNNVRVNLTQSQFDALTALTFNTGPDAFRTSTLLRLLNQGDYNGAADQFPEWNKVHLHGQFIVSQGLVNRRNAERNIFLNGVYP